MVGIDGGATIAAWQTLHGTSLILATPLLFLKSCCKAVGMADRHPGGRGKSGVDSKIIEVRLACGIVAERASLRTDLAMANDETSLSGADRD
jgi:hypothetical protein